MGKFLPDNSANANNDHSERVSLLELIPNAALAYDGNTDSFYFNELAAQWFAVQHTRGPIKNSALAVHVTKIGEQFPIQSERTPWQRACNGERVQGLEVVLSVAKQAPRFVLCNSSYSANTNESTPFVIVTMIDISTINADYQTLLNDRAQMGTIIEGMNAGIWHWNLQTGETSINDTLGTNRGLYSRRACPRHSRDLVEIHPPRRCKGITSPS